MDTHRAYPPEYLDTSHPILLLSQVKLTGELKFPGLGPVFLRLFHVSTWKVATVSRESNSRVATEFTTFYSDRGNRWPGR